MALTEDLIEDVSASQTWLTLKNILERNPLVKEAKLEINSDRCKIPFVARYLGIGDLSVTLTFDFGVNKNDRIASEEAALSIDSPERNAKLVADVKGMTERLIAAASKLGSYDTATLSENISKTIKIFEDHGIGQYGLKSLKSSLGMTLTAFERNADVAEATGDPLDKDALEGLNTLFNDQFDRSKRILDNSVRELKMDAALTTRAIGTQLDMHPLPKTM